MPAGSLPAAGNAAQSFQQQEDNVIHDGPLAGGVLTDNDIHPTDPAAGGLDPRYLVRKQSQYVMFDGLLSCVCRLAEWSLCALAQQTPFSIQKTHRVVPAVHVVMQLI